MKKLSVFISPLGVRDKRSVIFNEVIARCPDSDYSSVLYVTPDTFSQTEASRRFFSYLKTAHKKNSYIPFQAFTIKKLCTNLYETYKEKNIISDRIAPFILYEILGEKNIGYAHLLSDLLSKIRHYIPDRELYQIKEDIKSLIFEEKTMKRAVKAIEILELYGRELEEKKLIDFESAINKSIPLIKGHVSPKTLVLDGFFDPTPLELKIIETLIENADRIYAVVEENAGFLKFFEFTGETRRLKASNKRNSAGYYQYPSMEDEVEGIARGVKSQILGGVQPCEITVSFPVPSKYLPMLRRIFKKHGIPMNMVEYDISGSRPFTAMEDMITSIEDDYPRNEFLSFLTSVHFPGVPDVIKEWAISFSNRAGIVKGRQAWFSIKETLLNSTEKEITPKIEIIEEFQRETKKIINILEKIGQTRDITQFSDELEAVLHKFGYFDSLEETLAARYGDSITRGIDSVFLELRNFSKLFSLGEAGGNAGFYFKQLLRGLKISEKKTDGVRIVPFELVAELEPRVVYFGGMVENDLPASPVIDPILPEKVKQHLGLPFLEYYLDRQKRYFKRLLNSSIDDPHFSYPTADGEKMFLPSPFLDWEMNLGMSALQISTEEEVLVSEGSFKHRDFAEILWDGKLPEEKSVKRAIIRRFGPKAVLSVTAIDAYRRCPLRFYIGRFLGIEREEPPEFEVEARLWGKLAHKTMEYLFKDSGIEVEDMDKRLFKGLEISLKEFPIGELWSKVAKEIFQRLLPLLKEQETELRIKGFNPYMVEKSLKTAVDGLWLKGKIDRIDIKKIKNKRSKIKNDEKSDQVILLDYKTGAIDKHSLQLPLYAFMWQNENAEPVEKAGFYSLKNGRVELYPKKASMEEFIQDALKTASGLIRRMRKGVFEPVPFMDGECRSCFHSALCKGAK